MAAKKKRSKTELRAFVREMRTKFAPVASDTMADLQEKVKSLIAVYEAEGLGAQLKKNQPLSRCLAERGTVVSRSGPPVSGSEIEALERATGASLPPTLASLLSSGGFWGFHRDPQQEVRTLSIADMLERRPMVAGLCDRTPKEEGVLEGPPSAWKYGMCGVLPEELRRGAMNDRRLQ